MEIYLHIGYPKTATTWLQKKFFPHILGYAFVEREDIVKKILKPYALDFNPKETRRFFLKKYGEKLILSIEGFTGTTANFGLNGYLTKEHAYRLYDVFPEAKIILFIRKQQDIIASAYSQYIFGGGTYRINKYLHNHSKTRLSRLSSFSFPFFEYHYTIKLYCNLFNKDNVRIYLYEEFNHDKEIFIDRLLLENKFQVRQETIDIRKMTERFRVGILKLTYMTNLFTAEKMLNKYYLIHLPMWFNITRPILARLDRFKIFGPRPDTKAILGKKNYEFILEYYKKSNQILLNEFGIMDIIKYNYPL